MVNRSDYENNYLSEHQQLNNVGEQFKNARRLLATGELESLSNCFETYFWNEMFWNTQLFWTNFETYIIFIRNQKFKVQR